MGVGKWVGTLRCRWVGSPNYIFLFRLRLSRAITWRARKNPFADNALKRRAHGADSNYEHLYLQIRRRSRATSNHHPRPSHPFPFRSPIVITLLYRDVALTRVSYCTFSTPYRPRSAIANPKNNDTESRRGGNRKISYFIGYVIICLLLSPVAPSYFLVGGAYTNFNPYLGTLKNFISIQVTCFYFHYLAINDQTTYYRVHIK